MAAQLLKKLRIPPRKVVSLPGMTRLVGPVTVLAGSRTAAAPLSERHPDAHVVVSRKTGALRMLIVFGGGEVTSDIDWPSPPGKPEGFTVRCDARGIAVVAEDEAALRWAVATVTEILTLAEGTLRHFELSDWPHLALRGVMIDLSRSCVEKPSYIRRVIDLLSGYRCNMLQLYFEERLSLRKHPRLRHPLGYSPRQVAELARYAAGKGIALTPALATFGHAQGFLKVPAYRHLADGDQIYQFDPLNPEVGELLGDMFDDWASVTAGGYVNACCDEAPYSGNNERTAGYIARHGIEAFMARHVRELHAMLTRRGFRMMMWADMLKAHPATLEMIPNDIVLIEWNYDKVTEATARAIELYRAKGFEVVAAPAASRSGQVAAPRGGQITDNIPRFAALANRLDLKGLLCCQWESLPRSPRLSEPGHLLACRMAWTGSQSAPPAVRRRIYGDLTGLDAAAVDELMKKLSPDLMNRRFRRIQRDPNLPKTYHLTTHELISGDPLVYLRPRGASSWAKRLAGQYQAADILLKDAGQEGRDNWRNVLGFAVDCGRFSAWRRTKINEAGQLMTLADTCRRAGDANQAVELLNAAKTPLTELSELATKLNRDAPVLWAMDRFENDPTYALAYGDRFASTVRACDRLAKQIDRCAASISNGGPFTLSDAIAARRALVLRIFLREVPEVNILNLEVYFSDGDTSAAWRYDRMVQAFQPPSSRYDYPFVLDGELPLRIKTVRTRTQSTWQIERDLEIAVMRPIAPGEPARRRRGLQRMHDEEYSLVVVPGERYVLDEAAGDIAVFRLERSE